ncbi:hypothetical protein [Frankia gtarii]|nr:hypothetical protein [Frankia gtarii]
MDISHQHLEETLADFSTLARTIDLDAPHRGFSHAAQVSAS